MDDCWLDVPDARGVVAALAEIGVLVDGAGDQTWDLCDFLWVGAEDEGEGCGEGGCGLHRRECEFGDVVGVVEAKGSFDLVVCGALAHFADVGVEGSGEAGVDELGVGEDEGFLGVEADGDDVEGVLHGEAVGFFLGELGGVEEFFVIGEHYDQGDVEDFLEVSVVVSVCNGILENSCEIMGEEIKP